MKKQNIIFVMIFSIAVIYLLFQNAFTESFRNGHMQLTGLGFIPESFDLNDTIPKTQIHSYNIFMVETNKDRVEFSNKELCAVESAAFNNPSTNRLFFEFLTILNHKN